MIIILGLQMTETALKDYNRGRMYLGDMASKEGVPQFEDIAEAVQCAITQVKEA